MQLFKSVYSVQFLRLVHSVCDHHPNKYLLLSRNELEELKQNNNDNPNIDKIIQSNLHCAESEGMINRAYTTVGIPPSQDVSNTNQERSLVFSIQVYYRIYCQR